MFNLFGSWVLCISLVLQCSHSPHQQCLERRLVHSHWIPASHSNGPPTCTLRHPVSWASPNGSDTFLGSRGSLDLDHILYGFLSGSSDTRQVRLRSRRQFVSAARNFSDNLARLASALLNGQITNGKRSTVKMLPGSVLLCSGPVPSLLGWAYPEQLGLGSTACGLVLGDSIRPCTNGVSLLHRIAKAAPLNKPQTCSNSVPYTSGTTWSTISDGFGWWNPVLA